MALSLPARRLMLGFVAIACCMILARFSQQQTFSAQFDTSCHTCGAHLLLDDWLARPSVSAFLRSSLDFNIWDSDSAQYPPGKVLFVTMVRYNCEWIKYWAFHNTQIADALSVVMLDRADDCYRRLRRDPTVLAMVRDRSLLLVKKDLTGGYGHGPDRACLEFGVSFAQKHGIEFLVMMGVDELIYSDHPLPYYFRDSSTAAVQLHWILMVGNATERDSCLLSGQYATKLVLHHRRAYRVSMLESNCGNPQFCEVKGPVVYPDGTKLSVLPEKSWTHRTGQGLLGVNAGGAVVLHFATGHMTLRIDRDYVSFPNLQGQLFDLNAHHREHQIPVDFLSHYCRNESLNPVWE